MDMWDRTQTDSDCWDLERDRKNSGGDPEKEEKRWCQQSAMHRTALVPSDSDIITFHLLSFLLRFTLFYNTPPLIHSSTPPPYTLFCFLSLHLLPPTTCVLLRPRPSSIKFLLSNIYPPFSFNSISTSIYFLKTFFKFKLSPMLIILFII